MRKFLITGVAGSGKSTICKQLASMGYESHGIEDIDGMFAMYKKGTKAIFEDFDNSDPEKIKNSEWLCNIDKLKELLDKQGNEIAFYCGVASNMDDMIPLFDAVILLKISPQELHQRLSTREGTEDMGNTEESRQAVLGWKDWWESEIEERGVLIIDADMGVEQVAKEVVKKCLQLGYDHN